MGSDEIHGKAMNYRTGMAHTHSHNPRTVLRTVPHAHHERGMLSLSVAATLQPSNTLCKDKVKSSRKRRKLLLVVIAAVLVAAALLLGDAAWSAALVARSLQATVSAWQAAGPHTTSVGQLRQCLASLWWLGPLAPGAPRDPLRECGVQAGAEDWWTVFWHLREAKGRLACLQQSTLLALEEHEAFSTKAMLASVLLAAGLTGWALCARRAWRQGNNAEATVGTEARAADQGQPAEAPRLLHLPELSRQVIHTCAEEAFPAADERQQHAGAGGGSGLKEACAEGLVPEWQEEAGLHDKGSGDAHLEVTLSAETTGWSPVPDPCTRPASWPADPQQQRQATTPDVARARCATWPAVLPEQQQVVSGVTAVPWASGTKGLLRWREEKDEEAEAEEACSVEELLGGRVACLTRGQLAGSVEGMMELGRGTNGVVWLVRYWGALAATKTLLGAAPVDLLLEEARLLLDLDGAGGMPRVLAVCAAPPTLVLEYVGRTYDHFLDGCSVGGLMDSLVSIAERLAELHARGVVHNDLKANNITFTGPRDAPLFHVIDCGLACRVGQEAPCYVHEGEEDLYPWVAPEVGRRGPVFPSADVYSFGVLVKQVLPLLGDDLPDVSVRLQQLADSCTESQPWQRPPLALVAAILRLFQRDLPPPAK